MTGALPNCDNQTQVSASPQCAYRGWACVPSGPVNSLSLQVPLWVCQCFEPDIWTGIGDYHPIPDNCYVLKPIIYASHCLTLCFVVVLVVLTLWVTCKRIESRTVFIELVLRADLSAMVVISALIFSLLQCIATPWRLARPDVVKVGLNAPVTWLVTAGQFTLFQLVPHVLNYYAKATFSKTRIRRLNHSDSAQRRLQLFVNPITHFIMPIVGAAASLGIAIPTQLGNPQLALRIGCSLVLAFLALVLLLTYLLIVPLLRDLGYSLQRTDLYTFTTQERQVLTTMWRRLRLLLGVVMFVSCITVPVFILFAVSPQRSYLITYFLPAEELFCTMVLCVLVWTLVGRAFQRRTSNWSLIVLDSTKSPTTNQMRSQPSFTTEARHSSPQPVTKKKHFKLALRENPKPLHKMNRLTEAEDEGTVQFTHVTQLYMSGGETDQPPQREVSSLYVSHAENRDPV